MNNKYSFGYPQKCERCVSFSNVEMELRVAPHYKQGDELRVMLIGQDPTIFNQPERVKEVLMLDETNGQLTRWLKEIFGANNLDTITLYATNLVKCSFAKPPSTMAGGGLKFLKPYFDNCKEYLANEVVSFRPDCVLTLGEPSHKLFITILDNQIAIPDSMQSAFTGEFVKAQLQDVEFDYSPCLHIKTFRVAEIYGESVQKFKQGISSYFSTKARIYAKQS